MKKSFVRREKSEKEKKRNLVCNTILANLAANKYCLKHFYYMWRAKNGVKNTHLTWCRLFYSSLNILLRLTNKKRSKTNFSYVQACKFQLKNIPKIYCSYHFCLLIQLYYPIGIPIFHWPNQLHLATDVLQEVFIIL